jgi:hypothetical protein
MLVDTTVLGLTIVGSELGGRVLTITIERDSDHTIERSSFDLLEHSRAWNVTLLRGKCFSASERILWSCFKRVAMHMTNRCFATPNLQSALFGSRRVQGQVHDFLDLVDPIVHTTHN